jgi:putative ABC transport system permease protein
VAWLRLLVEKLRALTRRRPDDEAFEQEIDLHMRLLEERFRNRGLGPEEARLEARRAFGGIQQLKEEHREMRTGRWLTEAAQDVSHASRMLRRQPGFAMVTLLTLALGIGANAAVFSVVNAVILRPLPYPSVDRVERVGWDWNGRSAATGALAPFKFAYLREQTRAFEALATWQLWTVESGAGTAAAPLRVLRVSDDFLEVVGMAPARGRGFTAAERESGAGVALLTEACWRTRFGADADVLGQTTRLDDRTVVIVGVLPATFQFPEVSDDIDLVTPLALRADPSDLGANFPAMGRLRPGVTRAAAQADLDRVFADLRRERPSQFSGPDERAVLMRFDEIYLADVTRPLWTLFAGVLLVLLIACTNVANLLLARGTTRLREMAVRVALGASRGRLLRQGIAEGLVMSAIGGVAGVVLGTAGVHVLLGLAPAGIARFDEVRIDATVLGFAALVITVAGVVFGLAATGIGTLPRAGAAVSLATRGSSATRTGRRVRQLMIAVQSSLAMLLLVGAVLLVSGFYRLTRTPLGFDPHDVIALTFPRLPPELRTPARVAAAERTLRGALSAVPGVSAAASASVAPLAERGWNIPMTIDGRPDATEGAVEWRAVSREYAAVMGLHLLQGRWLSDDDVDAARPVIVVSAGFASRYFPDGHVLGQRVWLGVFRGQRRPNATDLPREIVGVVADIRDLGPTRSARRTVFIPQTGSQPGGAGLPAFVLRATGVVSHDSLRAAVRAADPALPEPILSTMESRLGARLARDRFSSLLMAVFASVALLLTAIGVYGVVSWIVRHATHEIGIRIALGAGSRRIVRAVLLRGLIPVGLGLGLGGAAALAASGLFTGLVVGATTVSAHIATAAGGVLIAAAAIAAWIPARRALRVDPVAVLRAD